MQYQHLRFLVAIIIGIVVTVTAIEAKVSYQSSQTNRPLTLNDIERLLKQGQSEEHLISLITKRGLTLRLSDEELEGLKAKGASVKVVEAIQRAKVIENERQIPTRKPRLWITYAQENKDTGNFGFLTQELQKAGVEVTYKDVAVKKGFLLWDQIAKNIEDPNLDGWAILLTKESLQSELCQEELAYALDRALSARGKEFALIGLVHQVGTQEIPLSLRVRGIIDLRNPQWAQEVLASLRHQTLPKVETSPDKYIWQVIKSSRNSSLIAVWVRPRFNELSYWRFIVPVTAPTKLITIGVGTPPQTFDFFGGIVNDPFEDRRTLQLNDNSFEVTVQGAANVITPGGGCFIVLKEPFPTFIGFAIAQGRAGLDMSTFEVKDINNLEVKWIESR